MGLGVVGVKMDGGRGRGGESEGLFMIDCGNGDSGFRGGLPMPMDGWLYCVLTV